MAFANHIETNSTSESIYEGKICAWFLNFLKNLKTQEKFELLHNNINEFLGEGIMDINFVKWFAKKINQLFTLDVCMHTPAHVPFGTKEQRKWKNKNINLIVDHFYLKPFVSLSLAWILYFHVWLQNKGKFSVWSQYYNHFGIPLRITTKQLP